MIKDIHKIYNFPKPEIADDQTVYTSYTMKSSIKDGIGHGAYGDVYRVMHIKSGQERAIKILKKGKAKTGNTKEKTL